MQNDLNSFAYTESTDFYEGKKLQAGDVLRVTLWAFGDAVILGFNIRGDAKVSRPYLYASSVGTTGPVPLLGCETYILSANDLKHYKKVGDSRTV